jgi:hypothetical protein
MSKTPQGPPISFRPPRADEKWLREYAERTGEPINRILLRAVRREREIAENRERGKDAS